MAEIPDLPGCVAERSTAAEAVTAIEELRDFWLMAQLDRDFGGSRHPQSGEWDTQPNYSGHLHLRVPRRLHQRLANQSARQGVSLNQYATFLLARASEPAEPAEDGRLSLR